MSRDRAGQINRRGFLAAAGASLMGVVLKPVGIVRADEVRPAAERTGAKRVLRVAHMTDMHVQPERAGDKGFAAALRHVQNLRDRPDLILTGGDTVMDSFSQTDERTTLQWNLVKSVLKQECSLPVKSCIGWTASIMPV